MKNDHGNEFRRYKNKGKGVWVGLEWPENEENRRPTVASIVVFAGPIRARQAAVGYEISQSRLSGGGAPTWVARV